MNIINIKMGQDRVNKWRHELEEGNIASRDKRQKVSDLEAAFVAV